MTVLYANPGTDGLGIPGRSSPPGHKICRLASSKKACSSSLSLSSSRFRGGGVILVLSAECRTEMELTPDVKRKDALSLVCHTPDVKRKDALSLVCHTPDVKRKDARSIERDRARRWRSVPARWTHLSDACGRHEKVRSILRVFSENLRVFSENLRVFSENERSHNVKIPFSHKQNVITDIHTQHFTFIRIDLRD